MDNVVLSQKEAVYQAHTKFDGDRAQMREHIAQGIVAGTVSCDKPEYRSDIKKALTYASGLISNWLKKDSRLNGGVKYEAATVRGPQVRDEKLKALTQARKAATAANDMELLTKIESLHASRVAELESEKAAKKAPNVSDAVAALAALGIEL